jgi:DNA-binding CsgD family transcriptional regulator
MWLPTSGCKVSATNETDYAPMDTPENSFRVGVWCGSPIISQRICEELQLDFHLERESGSARDALLIFPSDVDGLRNAFASTGKSIPVVIGVTPCVATRRMIAARAESTTIGAVAFSSPWNIVRIALRSVQYDTTYFDDALDLETFNQFAYLTAKEHDVLAALDAGMTRREAAAHLGVTVHAIKKRLQSIFTKLEVRSSREALSRARDLGLR